MTNIALSAGSSGPFKTRSGKQHRAVAAAFAAVYGCVLLFPASATHADTLDERKGI